MKERNSHFLRGTKNLSLFTDTKSSFLVLELFNPLKFLNSTILTKEFYLCCDDETYFIIIRCSNRLRMVLCLLRRPYTKIVSSRKAKTFRLIHFWLPPQKDYICEFYVSCDPYIVTNFFITKSSRCINFTNLLRHEFLHISVLPLPIIRNLFIVHLALVYGI
jgi:hypothetical protein